MATNAFYEFREWHSEPECHRVVVPCTWASGVMVVCLTCGCASELEALGGRSTLLEAARVTGTQEELTLRDDGILRGPGPV